MDVLTYILVVYIILFVLKTNRCSNPLSFMLNNNLYWCIQKNMLLTIFYFNTPAN